MQRIGFEKLVKIVIAVLSVLIVILGFVVNTQQTRLVKVSISGNKDQAHVKSQRIEFRFNSPISKTLSNPSLKAFIDDKEFELGTKEFISGENVYVFFDNNLEYGTSYKIELEGLKDVFHKDVAHVSTQFKTAYPQFYYLHLNEGTDRILKYDLETEKETTFFEAENIQNYVFNSNYVAVVIEAEEYSKLLIQDAKSGKQVKELHFDFQQIGKIDMTEKGNKVLFTLQDYKFEDEFVIPTTGFVPYYYDIDSENQQKFEYANMDFDISEIIISPDSNFVLFEDSIEGFYLVDLNDSDSGIALGRYISTGGFSFDAQKIVFLSFEPEVVDKNIFIVYYDIKSGLKTLTNGDYEVIDPKFFNNSDRMIYSKEKGKVDSRGIYKIVESDLEGKENDIFDMDDFSLEYPRLSFDDRYVVVEKYSKDQLLDYNYSRTSGYLTKPEKAELVVYDLKEKKIVIQGLKGIEANWL